MEYQSWIVAFLLLFRTVTGTVTVTVSSGTNAVAVKGTLTLSCTISPLKYGMWWATPGSGVATVCFCSSNGNACSIGIQDSRITCSSDVSNKLFTLTVTDVRLSDEGRYTCTHNADTTEERTLDISVQVPITSVDVTSPTTSPVTISENSPSTFVCETSAGRPQATITWFKQLGNNDALSLQGGNINTIWSEPSGITRSTLQFTPTRSDHNFRLYCTAYNTDASSLYTSLNQPQLYVQYAPDSGPVIEGRTSGSTFYILDGKQQSMTCSIAGGRPLASLSWNCFSGVVQNQSTGTTTKQQVTWTAARAHDGQRCTCQASHADFALSSTNAVFTIIQALLPPTLPTFMVQNQPVAATVSVIEGSSVSVTCSSTSYPPPAYSWNPRGSSPSSDILTLNSVSTSSNDIVYTCTVTNTMTPTLGSQESGSNSASITLNVLFPPRAPVLRYSTIDGPTISSTFNVVRDDSFSIYCNTEGNPDPSNQWPGQSANNNKLDVTGIQTDTSWTCTATNVMLPSGAATQTGSFTSSVTANVLYGPSTPKLTYHNSSSGPVVVENGLLKVFQGKSFTVTCDGSNSKPQPAYTWSGILTSPTGTLRVDNLQSRTSSTCTASNVMTRTYGAEVSNSSTQAITVDVLYPPKVRPLENKTAVENATFSKDCLVTPGNPDATEVKWIRVKDNAVISIGKTMTIGHVSKGNAGTYRCTAKNTMQPTGEAEQDHTDSAMFMLTVFYSASITEFTINGAQGTVPLIYDENTTLTIVCVVDSNPGSDITIQRDGSVKETAAIMKEITHTVKEASCLNAGIYSCAARNQYNGNAFPTLSQQVFIRCPPRPLGSVNNYTYYHALNESVTLNLIVTAYPEPTYRWFKQEKEITKGVSKNSHQTNLTLEQITQHDYGQYKVVVTNNQGTLEHLFFVAAHDKPQKPTNVTSEPISHNSALIQWVQGFNGGQEQTFYIEYWPSSQNNVAAIKQKSDSGESPLNITLTGLDPATEYTVQVYGVNSIGNSTKSTQVTFTTKMAPTKDGDPSYTAIIGGAAGGLSVALIVIVIVLLVIRRYKCSKDDNNCSSTGKNNHLLTFGNVPCKSKRKGLSNDMQNGAYTEDDGASDGTSSNDKKGKKQTNSKKSLDVVYENTMIDRSVEYRPDEPVDVVGGTDRTSSQENEVAIVIEPPKRTESAILLRELEEVVFSPDSAAERFSEEFQKFREGMTKEHNAALQNRSRNKYRNLYAYDDTRVVLDMWDDASDTDYINACYIQGFKKPNAYIASQGPIKNNLTDFWRMVWQTNAVQIVMLTNIIEHGKEKCIRYWPEDGSELYGRITVTLAARETFSSFVIRTFMVNKDFEPPRQVQQFHFTAWPDKDVPSFCSSLVHFRSKVKAAASTCDGPVVVHCSAGIGRTGTYIAIDYLVDEAEELGYVDVVGCVTALREQRVNMVQKEKQYVFVHLSLVEILLLETSGVSTSDFVESYKHLLKPVNGKRQINSEFDLLWKLSPKVEELSDNTDDPLAEQNIIQDDEYMPSYSELGTRRYGEFIDAAFLPLYRDDNAMIIAKTPTEWTIDKFWNLVYHQQVHSIVMMNQDGVYWPGDNETFTHGHITISNNGAIKKGSHYVVKLTMFNNGSERDIQLLLFGTWEGDQSIPDDPSHVLSALDIVGSNQKKTGNHPVVVHCMDGVERSGLFCVIAALLDRTQIEQDVAISQVIQEIRNRRKNVIPNVEQFEFCHEVVCAFLQQYDLYSNFTFGE